MEVARQDPRRDEGAMNAFTRWWQTIRARQAQRRPAPQPHPRPVAPDSLYPPAKLPSGSIVDASRASKNGPQLHQTK